MSVTQLDGNLPPVPVKTSLAPKPSFTAYVWRGDKFDDIGTGETQGSGHLLRLHLGAKPGDVIELRAVESAFYPGYRRPEFQEPKPTFLAFFAGTDDRAGTAWPHDDGKGHRLKLRCTILDGTDIELRDTGSYMPADAWKPPIRMRIPRHRPRANW